MASVMRKVPVAWTTGVGGSGVSIFYCGDTDDITPNLATFFTAIRAMFPDLVTWSIPAAGDKISDDTGTLTGAWSGGTAAVVTGSGGTGSYVAGTGTYVRWITGAIIGGHKVQGRTFLCPMMAAQFDAGSIANASVTTIQTAATTLVASNKLIVWHRPTALAPTSGGGRLAIAAIAPDKVTSLRSRRS